MNAIPLEQEIEYPTSDGQPMAETTLHREIMTDLIQGLKNRYVAVPDVWVGGNLFLCYEKGNPAACLAPDVLLAKGVSKWDRPNYLLWEETPPVLVIEVTSRKTRREDLGKKKDKYERIGVEEYLLFDPYNEYLRPSLQGLHLEKRRYQPMHPQPDGSVISRTAGLTFRREGERLRMVDTATGEPLLWPEEVEEARARAEAKAAEEVRARQAAEERAREAEERLRALEEEVKRLRGT